MALMIENLKNSRQEQIAAATEKYRQLLARADAPSASDMKQLQECMNILDLTTADLESDADVFNRAAECRRQIVPEAEIEKLEAHLVKVAAEVELAFRDGCKKKIDLIHTARLPYLFNQLCGETSSNESEFTRTINEKHNEAHFSAINARNRRDGLVHKLESLESKNPRVFG